MRLFTTTVAFLLLCTACGSGDDDVLPVPGADTATSSSSSTTEAPPAAATTTETTEATSAASDEVEEAIPEPSDGEIFDEYIASRVQQYFDLANQGYANPSAQPEVDYAGLEELAAEEQLVVVYQTIRGLHSDGQAVREPDEPAVGTSTDEEHRVSGVISIDETETELTVFDCEVFDDDTYDVETDEVVATRVITALTVTTLEKFDQQWKVTATEVSQKIEGVAGCYLASESDFPY